MIPTLYRNCVNISMIIFTNAVNTIFRKNAENVHLSMM